MILRIDQIEHESGLVGGPHINDLSIAGDSVTLAVTTGSSSIALPVDAGTGGTASRVRVWVSTGSAAAYFSLTSGAGAAVVATSVPIDDESGAVIVTTGGASQQGYVKSRTGPSHPLVFENID